MHAKRTHRTYVYVSLCTTLLPQEKQPSEIFQVIDPSTSAMPSLALLSPVAGEHVATGAKFSVSWTSPSIDKWVLR